MKRFAISVLCSVTVLAAWAQAPISLSGDRPLLIPPKPADWPQPSWEQGVWNGPTRGGDSRSVTPGFIFPGRVPPHLGGPGGIIHTNRQFAADLNGDGILDLVTQDTRSDGYQPTLVIRYGRPDGSFDSPAFSYAVLGGAAPLAAGRFNADDLPDLVVLYSAYHKLTLFLAQPGGGFAPAGDYPTNAAFLVGGDFDNDGFSDVATTDGYVRRGQADGTLGPPEPIHLGSSSGYTRSLCAADLNGDHIDDLVGIGGCVGQSCVWVMYGRQDLGLGPAQEFALPSTPTCLGIGDYNGDGIPDIAVSTNYVSVFYGQPGGVFNERSDYPELPGGSQFASGDLDGDGRHDLFAFTNSYGYFLSVYYGQQGGGFRPVQPHAWCDWWQAWTIAADVDRDGRSEVLHLLSGQPATLDYVKTRGELVTRWDIRVPNSSGAFHGICVADLDHDGALDLAVTDKTRGEVRILWGDGTGAFSVDGTTYSTGGPAWRVAAADVNNDGLLDLAVTTTAGSLRLFYQVTPRAFGTPQDYAIETGRVGVAVADFNGDGRTDVAAGNKVYYSQPDGTLGNPQSIQVTGDIVAADFDWDGWVDIGGQFNVLGLGVVYNQAGAGFTNPQGLLLSQAPREIAVGDFNGDGWRDLAAWQQSGTVAVLYGQPGGGFAGPPQMLGPFSVWDYDWGITAADFNRDGRDDLCVTDQYNVALLLGAAENPLTEMQLYKCGYWVYSMATGDFDRDGRIDLVGADIRSSLVSVFTNQDGHKATGDLQALSVIGPANGLTGEVIPVDWTVQNMLPAPLTAKWTDGIYLSRDDQWDINDRLLGVLEYNATLPGGASYTRDASVSLPAVAAGNYYLLMRADMYDDIREIDAEGDNVVATPITVDVPALTLGQWLPGEFAFAGQTKLYKVVVTADEDLLVTLDAAYDEGANELYIRYEYPATRVSYDAKYDAGFAPDQTARIPGTQAGTYYILAVANPMPADGQAPFNLKPEYLPFAVEEYGPTRGGNTGQVTIQFIGSGFKPNVAATLHPEVGPEIHPLRTNWVDSGEFTATFDLDGQPHGACIVQVTNPDGAQITPEPAFMIEAGVELTIEGFLGGPSVLRPGQTGQYGAHINNTGNVDIPYVIVDISVDAQYVRSVRVTRPDLADPPPIPGIDWSQGDPTTTVDGRIHHPLLLKPFPVSGYSFHLDLAIEVAPEAPLHSSYDVTVALRAMGHDDMVSTLTQDADLVRWILLSDPPVDPVVEEIRGDPQIWDPLSALLEDPLAWRQAYMDAAADLGLFDGSGCSRGYPVISWQSWLKNGAALFAIACGFLPVSYPLLGVFIGVQFFWQIDQWEDEISQAYLHHYTAIVLPGDPNGKSSPNGWGPDGFIRQEDPIPYVVQFENIPGATAAALKVEVTDQLHANLDWSTLTLDEIGFAGNVIKVPEGLSHYEGRVEMDGWTWNETDGWHRYDVDGNPVMPLVVDVEADIDIATGVVRWTIVCADPNTGNFPEDAYAGFLPPNQEAIFYPDPNSPDPNSPVMIHPGEGYLTYSVRPVADLPTGTQITNQATIVFDWNAPMDTPVVLNTIDAVGPTSAVSPLPPETHDAHFDICCTGQDDPGGSGVFLYAIYVSDNDSPYSQWLLTEDACATFTDTRLNHTYRFYSVAQDHVGNVEPPPTDPNGAIVPDAVTIVVGLRGDMNCDGTVDFGDINPFVLQLSNFAAWQATYVGCNPLNGDINDDGIYGEGSFGDINPFVALLTGGG